MNGLMTDDDLFWKTSASLNSSQKAKVKAYFNANYGSLKDWIEGDFSWSDEDKALRIWGWS